MSRAKQDLEEKHLRVSREKAEFASQLQENEEELQVGSRGLDLSYLYVHISLSAQLGPFTDKGC